MNGTQLELLNGTQLQNGTLPLNDHAGCIGEVARVARCASCARASWFARICDRVLALLRGR
jgi:hypothetical protein